MIQVYNEKEGSFYCHHDVPISAYPVCMEWLNYDPEDPKPGKHQWCNNFIRDMWKIFMITACKYIAGNLCAIGNMTSIIEVWDLDLLNSVEPAYKLGRKPNKKKGQKRVGHKDGVLDLAWNQNYTFVFYFGEMYKIMCSIL